MTSYVFMYIHNTLQPFSQVLDLAAHATYVVYVSFIHNLRDLQFDVDFE